MREYETLFVLKPQVPENEAEEFVDRLVKLVEQHKGEMVFRRPMGRRPIAFPIHKEKEGIYFHLDYACEGSLVSELEKLLRFDERVIRFLTVALQENVDVAQRKKQLEEAAMAAAQATTLQ